MADYRAVRERFLRPIEVTSAFMPDKVSAQRLLAAAGTALSEWEARPILAAYGIGTMGPARWQPRLQKPWPRRRPSAAPSR